MWRQLSGFTVICLAGHALSSLLQEIEPVRYNKYYNNKPFRRSSPNKYKSFLIIYEAEGGCFGTQISHCGDLLDILENHSSNNYTPIVLQCSMLQRKSPVRMANNSVLCWWTERLSQQLPSCFACVPKSVWLSPLERRASPGFVPQMLILTHIETLTKAGVCS